MNNIYPQNDNDITYDALEISDISQDIINFMTSGYSREMAIGHVLNGNNNVPVFNEAWELIENEGQAIRNVNPGDYDTEEDYLNALSGVANYADPDLFYVGLKAEQGVDNFTDLKALYELDELDGGE